MHFALSILNNSLAIKCVHVVQCEFHTADLNLSPWLQQVHDSGQDEISMIPFLFLKTDLNSSSSTTLPLPNKPFTNSICGEQVQD